MPSVLAYWPFQGYAQPIRLMLAYVEEEFEDKFYYVGPAPDYNKDGWYNDKYNLGLDFPNLPYYIDEKVKLSQSHTILRYLNRKHGLDNLTEEERLRMDLVDREIDDFRMDHCDLCYNPRNQDLSKLRKTYFSEKLPLQLKQFEEFLGERSWLAGENITFVDFAFYTYLNMNTLLESSCCRDFPKLEKYLERFEGLPTVKKYMESSCYVKGPLWNRYAKIGNQWLLKQ